MLHNVTNNHQADSLVRTLLKDLRLVALMALAQASYRMGMAGMAADALWTQWWVSAVGLTPLVLCISCGMRVLPSPGLRRCAALCALALGAGVLSFILCMSAFGSSLHLGRPSQWLTILQWRLFLSAMLAAMYECLYRSRAAAEDLQHMQLRGVMLERDLILARLHVLHAQVEPHFLFNSLANLRRLLRTDVSGARGMLADLLRYLEETLPRLRDERSTLEREVVLVRAFLSLHQVRMGARLQVEFDIPASLLQHQVPPMSVLTLVENALKHGLHPLPEGGAIRIAAHAGARQLTLTVADTGRGLGSANGQGMGLANLRARLQALYGATASLSLALNAPHGLVATIALPEAAQ